MSQQIHSIDDLPEDADDLKLGDASPIIGRIIEGVVAKVLPSATAKSVYGEPVTQGHRTIIPVAQVSHRFGFGGGAGAGVSADEFDEVTHELKETGSTGQGGGGGGGGQLNVKPVGYIEITPEGTYFVPIVDRNSLLTAVMPFVGLAIVIAIWRLTRR